MDLYLAGGRPTARNYLYRNLGNGESERLSDAPFGGKTTGAQCPSWVDYDRDGFVDLYNQLGYWEGVGPYNDELYQSLGDGTFQK